MAPGVSSPGARATGWDASALHEVPLPRPHGHRKRVAGRREGTQEVRREGARRQLGPVEVDDDRAVGARRRVRRNRNRYPPSAAAPSPAPVASAKTAHSPPPASTVTCTVTAWPPRVKASSPPSPSPRWRPSALATRTVLVSGYGVNLPLVRAAGSSGQRAMRSAARSRPDSGSCTRTARRPSRSSTANRRPPCPARARSGGPWSASRRAVPSSGRPSRRSRRRRWRSPRGGPPRAATAPGWREVVLPENRPVSGHR